MSNGSSIVADGFIPVSHACLSTLKEAPCDLYLHSAAASFDLLIRAGKAIDLPGTPGLPCNKLHINSEDEDLYFQAVKDTLDKIVRSPLKTAKTKSAALHATCKEAIDRAVREPRGAFVKQVESIIVPMVEFIVSDKSATKNLMHLSYHDSDTCVHSLNVAVYGIGLSKIIYGDDGRHDLFKLATGFLFHDLGKCQIPIDVLREPGALSERQREVIKTHPERGYQMLKQEGLITEESRIITLQHHERDDGSGYPRGIKGDEIHSYARICRIADIYEALTTDRPYHVKKTPYQALRYMKECEAVDVDPELLRHFAELFI